MLVSEKTKLESIVECNDSSILGSTVFEISSSTTNDYNLARHRSACCSAVGRRNSMYYAYVA
jgi:hypothetical protein